MTKESMKKIWPLLSFVIGMLVGSGSIWQYQQIQLDKERLILERKRTTIEKLNNINNIMKNRGECLKNIMELSPKVREAINNVSGKSSEHVTLLHIQLKKEVERFNNYEIDLARIQRREPIKFILEGVFPDGNIVIDHLPPASISTLAVFQNIPPLQKNTR